MFSHTVWRCSLVFPLSDFQQKIHLPQAATSTAQTSKECFLLLPPPPPLSQFLSLRWLPARVRRPLSFQKEWHLPLFSSACSWVWSESVRWVSGIRNEDPKVQHYDLLQYRWWWWYDDNDDNDDIDDIDDSDNDSGILALFFHSP